MSHFKSCTKIFLQQDIFRKNVLDKRYLVEGGLIILSHYPKRIMWISHRWTGRGGPVPWPPRLPNLNPLDFFFWGYSKNIVYDNASITRLDDE